MKKILLAAALTACAAPVFAEPSIVLKVKGVLTNSACSPEIGNNGVVDYDEIPLNTLSATAVNQIGQRQVDFTITCLSPTKVSWEFVDNNASSRAEISVEDVDTTGSSSNPATGNTTFGVGTTAGGVKIGAYAVYVDTASLMADSNAVDFVYASVGDTTSWTNNSKGATMSDSRTYTVAASGTTEPLAISSVTYPLVTSLAVQDTTTLAVTDNTDLHGQLTISLRYL